MTIDELLKTISARAIQLRKSGDELIARGDQEALDAALVHQLHVHKTFLFEQLNDQDDKWWNPPLTITPQMLPLVELTQEEIEQIVNAVPGGAANVQDIYPLAPLQEGILFHHLMGGEGDPYLLAMQFSFDSRARLDRYISALHAVVDRHDILRTAVLWEGLSEPVQVVLRKAALQIEEVKLDASTSNAADQLYERFNPRHFRIDIGRAPLLRIYFAHDAVEERWLAVQLMHHLAGDHGTLEVMWEEIQAHLLGQQDRLPAPLPFRNLVAHARFGVSQQEHEAFFQKMLGDVDEHTAPFGLLDIRGDGIGIEEAHLSLDVDLARRLRVVARRLHVSVASICHLAWARVLSKVSGRENVVFGTVLFGRMQGGAGSDRVMGLFINTLPIRIHTGEQGAETSVRQTHALLAELMHHEHASLALAQRCSAVPAPTPLFSAMLNYRHSSGAGQRSEETHRAYEGMRVLRGEERTNYPLTLSVEDLGHDMGLTAQAPASIRPIRICQFMATTLTSLVEALETAPSKSVRTLSVLPPAERDQLLYQWNDTATEYPHDSCIQQLFEQQAEKSPEAVALVFEDHQLTYAELNRRANRLAHYLRELGVKPDARVALCMERGFEMIIALLAVLKAGGAYVSLDPTYPIDRLRFMIEDAAPIALLTQYHLRTLYHQLSDALPVIDLTDPTPWNQRPVSNIDPASIELSSQHLAYVIYTSGSTGTPKGVMVEHRGVIRLVRNTNYIQFHPEDVVAQASNTSFDAATFEIWGALLNGSRLVVISQDVLLESTLLGRTLKQHAVNILWLAVGLFNQHTASGFEEFGRLRYLIVGGDALDPRSIEHVLRSNPPQRLVNGYGPTETTTFAITHEISVVPQDAQIIPIGRPISNTRIYILDGHGEPVPIGVSGELYIGGAGVARGYLNRPDLTAEKFLLDPFVDEAGARMYRTGDLGRYLPNGNIEFLGRNDFQVKIRGFRIELGEIEARLGEHPGIREAVVVAREDVPGDKRLVAYCTAAQSEPINLEALRSSLSAVLPGYMVPAAYVLLESLPLTPNGKLDRRALPAPEQDAYATRGYEPPRGEIEEKLAAVWAEVLKLDRVGRHDNFFELGGHSLLAVRVVSRIRQELDADVGVRDLFAYPELAALAGVLENAVPVQQSPILPAARSASLPLSFAQQRLWFLAQMEGASEAYHIPFGLRLKGDLNGAALRQALDRIVGRHEALRTTFASVDGTAEQKIASIADSLFLLLEEDLRQQGDVEAALQQQVVQEAETSFDLQAGPLIRGRLIRLSDEEHALLITMHHIVSDGWSMGVLVNELSALYTAFLRGEEDPLLPLPIQYADYAVWQREWIEGKVLQQQAAYWKTALADVPTLLELPADHPRPVQTDYAGAFAPLMLDEQLTAGLRDLSRRHGATLYMTLLASWAVLLARLSGHQDLVVGTPTANRGRAEIERLIGLFVNTLAVRIDLSGSPTVSELLEQVKSQALAAQHHQDIPFEQVVEILQPVRSLSHSPLFQVMFAWQNNEPGTLELPGLELQPLGSSPHRIAKFDMALSLGEAGNAIAGGIEYATTLFEPSTIERYLDYFRSLLEAMVADETGSVDLLPMLSAAERNRVLYEWNDTKTEYPSDQCVHELFEAQVERTPSAIAVVFEDEELSYGELNARANRLAHHLRELGVKPDDRVAICVERSFEMIVGLLAVLKAGGAYVPLDPAYPVERLGFMIEDSAPVALLTQTHLAALFTGHDPALPVLDLHATEKWSEQPQTNPDPHSIGLTPHHLAYIIYTSGSTGTPKGVMVEHRQIVARLSEIGASLLFSRDDVMPNVSSFAFDISILEVLLPLVSGGRTQITDAVRIKDPDYLLEQTRTITVFNAVTSLMDTWCQHLQRKTARQQYPNLRVILVGGEPVPKRLIEQLCAQFPNAQVIETYGPTESSLYCTSCIALPFLKFGSTPPIGRPIGNTQVYILDAYGEPVPVGVAGEMYIGGAGVARGYLNRPDLTAEKFLLDPFVDEAEARMYRTGDLGRWLADGNIEFLGRNDFQVKIRGFRIELGEIESRLMEHPDVGEAVVVAREDVPGDKRLVAYYTSLADGIGAEQLRLHLLSSLPDHMVPAAYVRLESFPLTPNGKLDRRALPAPEQDAYATRGYEPPRGEIEEKLAAVWAEVLKLDRVGRHDHFFELGGHSLLAVTLIERMRRLGFKVDVRSLFATPTLADLAAIVDADVLAVEVSPNLIPSGCQAITPQMLPLVELTQEEIEQIVNAVPGGAANVQDIYPLAPLQEGILFHHLMGGEGDPYLLAMQFSFDSRARLDRYISALQAVVDRHDILRTAVLREGLSEPVQVVLRKAELQIEEVKLDPEMGDVAEQLYARFDPRHFRISVQSAPLLRLYTSYDAIHNRWLLMTLRHHLTGDHTTDEVMKEEIQAHLLRRTSELPAPQPFRNLVAQARSGVSPQEHEKFFERMLGDVDEPTLPFGLANVQGDGSDIEEARLVLDDSLARRIRAQARRMGVSAASLCHLAWARLLSKLSSREDVVFGTVLFGRMQGGEGADRVMGLFINTLPILIRVDEEGAESAVRRTHRLLADLLLHEHASLALAQRCSAIPAPTPLFSALLNYRHNPGATQVPSEETMEAWRGIRGVRGEERTNYPFTLSVSDLGEGFSLDAQTPVSIGPMQVCQYMQTVLGSLVEALETSPARAICSLEVLPPGERNRVLYEWNDTKAEYPSDQCVHELFEAQVERTPAAVAVVFEDEELSYGELNARANRLAHHLRELGVKPDDRVAICVERGLEMIVGLLAVLKAGGAYVPLDPAYPVERLRFMLEDSEPVALLTQTHLAAMFKTQGLSIIELDAATPRWERHPETNLDRDTVALNSRHLAYIIYTSGSTGTPKGIAIEHKNTVNLIQWGRRSFDINTLKHTLFSTSLNFDMAVFECFVPITLGDYTHAVRDVSHIPKDITLISTVPSALNMLLDLNGVPKSTEMIHLGGEPVKRSLLNQIFATTNVERVCNLYGPSETTTYSTLCTISRSESTREVTIGRPISNVQVYILDAYGEPVPVGVAGEMYIGGAGVARGYLNRPDLTAEKFLLDPFVDEAGARMYRTGDLGRWLADGNIEFLGRNDFQVKIRGFRIELGEIESRLGEHPDVREAVVVAREDVPGDKRLVAYYTSLADAVGAEQLRLHLLSSLPEHMVPAAYVLLESFPLTLSGKLDRRALPAPEQDAYATRGYEPPRGEIEEKLVAVWAELLKLDRVGRHDNFFELGGHSLLATQLINKIQTTFKVELSLRTLLETATVARLAEQIDNSIAVRQIEVLLPIRTKGTLKPIFFVHPGGGLSQCYIGFLKHLDRERPIYGLQSRNFTASSLSVQTIEEMAVDYYDEIRKVQPTGPYHLAGWSIGGQIAFAIANVIQRLGDEVAFLSVFDSIPFPSREAENTDPYASQTLLDFAYDFFGQDLRSQCPTLQALCDRLRQDNRLPHFIHENHFPVLLQNIRDASTQGQTFVPMKYPGDLLIFIATEKKEIDVSYFLKEWQPYVGGAIRYHLIACSHGEMMNPIPLAEIASLLEIELKNLRAECGEHHPVP